MAAELTLDEKYTLMTRNLQEVLGEDLIKARLATATAEDPFSLYWGTACTGRPHIGYFVPLTKIGDLLRAGCKVTILFADLHAYLDNMKAPWELLKFRTEYYEAVIRAALSSVGVPLERLHFVRGTDFELSREYTLDVYRLSTLVTEHDAKKAGAEVVKQVEHPLLSGLLYPGLQVLDEEYLHVDCQFGGVDQRKIFVYAEKYLPALGYKRRAHLMNPMVPGLMGSKMSSSVEDSKIDLLDDAATVTRKIKKAFCEEGNVTDNGLLSFAKMVLFPLYDGKKPFSINRPEKFGGPVSYATYAELEKAFAEKALFPKDLKDGMTAAINQLLEPIREAFKGKEELVYKAYPELRPQPKPAKQPKQPKQQPKALPVDISRANIVVGELVSVAKHPDADSLFLETVDLGEKYGKVTVVSGLANYYKPEDLQGKRALFLQNLKPAKMRGIESCAMILAASNEDHTKVEVVFPPQDAPVGERVSVEGYNAEPDAMLNPKKKVWDQIVPDLKTNEKLEAAWKGIPLMTSVGPCKTLSLTNAGIH